MIGFVGAKGDPLELLEFAEEVFDEVTGFVCRWREARFVLDVGR